MFCPVGYRPAIELWREFVLARLPEIYDSAVRSYNDPDFIAGLTRGSPLDICEHLFLKSLAAIGVHVASPKGEIMRLHVLMDDGVPNLFGGIGPYSSALYAARSEITDDQTANRFINNARFQSWSFEADDNGALAQKYVIASDLEDSVKRSPNRELFHHTLLHNILRNSYMISKEVPIWAGDTSNSGEVAPLIENFGGWAICIDEETYQGEWQDYLTGRKQVYPDAKDSNAISSRGRPRLNAAYAAFEAMNFEKGPGSWEQLAKRIDRETGEKPSHKSLRNWRDEHMK